MQKFGIGENGRDPGIWDYPGIAVTIHNAASRLQKSIGWDRRECLV